MRDSADAVIIGGGVNGCSTAYHLAKKGLKRIALLEKNYIGSGASGRNAGLVQAARESKEQVILHNASLKMIEKLPQELDFNIMFRQCGYVVLAQSEAKVALCREQIKIQNENGVLSTFLTPSEVKKMVAIVDIDKILGAVYYEKSGAMLPWALVWGFEKAARRLGVDINNHTEVVDIKTSDNGIESVVTNKGEIKTQLVINAAGGMGEKKIAKMVGLDLPVYSVRREALITESFKPFINPVVSFHAPLGGYIWQGLRGDVLLMTYQPVDKALRTFDNQDSTLDYLIDTAHVLTELFPPVKHLSVLRQWAGIRDASPDGWPILGRVEQIPGFICANGFSGIGFQLGPIVGKLLSELIVDGKTSISLDPFNIKRFVNPVTKSYDLSLLE
jgi:sarcosine oxidase subunit beta